MDGRVYLNFAQGIFDKYVDTSVVNQHTFVARLLLRGESHFRFFDLQKLQKELTIFLAMMNLNKSLQLFTLGQFVDGPCHILEPTFFFFSAYLFFQQLFLKTFFTFSCNFFSFLEINTPAWLTVTLVVRLSYV